MKTTPPRVSPLSCDFGWQNGGRVCCVSTGFHLKFTSCLSTESSFHSSCTLGLPQRTSGIPGAHQFFHPTHHHENKKLCRQPRARRSWIKPGRTQAWWNSFANNIVPSEKWKDNFRIPRATFYSLCDILRAHIELKTTKMQDTVDVERQIAMTLYYLAD